MANTATSNFGMRRSSLMRSLAENWWLFLLRGAAGIVFGILTLIWPGISLVTLVLLFGAYALVDGACALGAGIFGTVSIAPRWWLIVVGLLGVAAGVATFAMPGITAIVLLYFIAGWAIAAGIFQIIGAVQLRKEIENEWWLVLNGILSVLFGIGLFVLPGAGALALILVIGLYAIVYGVVMVVFAFSVRNKGAATAKYVA